MSRGDLINPIVLVDQCEVKAKISEGNDYGEKMEGERYLTNVRVAQVTGENDYGYPVDDSTQVCATQGVKRSLHNSLKGGSLLRHEMLPFELCCAARRSTRSGIRRIEERSIGMQQRLDPGKSVVRCSSLWVPPDLS